MKSHYYYMFSFIALASSPYSALKSAEPKREETTSTDNPSSQAYEEKINTLKQQSSELKRQLQDAQDSGKTAQAETLEGQLWDKNLAIRELNKEYLPRVPKVSEPAMSPIVGLTSKESSKSDELVAESQSKKLLNLATTLNEYARTELNKKGLNFTTKNSYNTALSLASVCTNYAQKSESYRASIATIIRDLSSGSKPFEENQQAIENLITLLKKNESESQYFFSDMNEWNSLHLSTQVFSDPQLSKMVLDISNQFVDTYIDINNQLSRETLAFLKDYIAPVNEPAQGPQRDGFLSSIKNVLQSLLYSLFSMASKISQLIIPSSPVKIKKLTSQEISQLRDSAETFMNDYRRTEARLNYLSSSSPYTVNLDDFSNFRQELEEKIPAFINYLSWRSTADAQEITLQDKEITKKIALLLTALSSTATFKTAP